MASAGQYKVKTISGFDIEVMSADERSFYNAQKKAYQKEFTFSAASDLSDLDRLLLLELQAFRAQVWLASGRDYYGAELNDIEIRDLNRKLKEINPQITQVKTDLGMTRSQREKEQHESIGAYINDLKIRAKAHGIRREKQLAKAIYLMNDLKSLIGTFRRTNQLEKEKLDILTAEDLIDHIEQVIIPQFDAVDAYFREHEQKFWVGKI